MLLSLSCAHCVVMLLIKIALYSESFASLVRHRPFYFIRSVVGFNSRERSGMGKCLDRRLCLAAFLHRRTQSSVARHPKVMQMLANFSTLCHTRQVAKPHFRLHTPSAETANAGRIPVERLGFPSTPRARRASLAPVFLQGFMLRVNVYITARKHDFFSPFKIRRSDVLLLYLPALETGSVTVALFQLPSRRALQRARQLYSRLPRNTFFVKST